MAVKKRSRVIKVKIPGMDLASLKEREEGLTEALPQLSGAPYRAVHNALKEVQMARLAHQELNKQRAVSRPRKVKVG